MKKGNEWHKLGDVDLEKRTGTCSVCGPTTVKVSFRTGRAPDRMCMTVVRQKRRKYNQSRRQSRQPGDYLKSKRWVDGRTRVERQAVVEKQGGRCAICRKEDRLVGDHCHATGVPRGMLCYRCNIMLGMAGDDLDILAAAAEYVSQYL